VLRQDKIKLGIVGMGHVGNLTHNALKLRAETVTYDKAKSDRYPSDGFQECEFIVVCVDTPASVDGSADLGRVHEALQAMPPKIPVVLRSTVPPETCDALANQYDREVIFWPEYLGEAHFAMPTWERLTTERPFQLIGGRDGNTTSRWLDLLAETFGPLMRIYCISPTEAELVKYMENSYFAMKVTFVNEFRSFVDSLGLNWQRVREGWLLDPRVDRDHSDAFRSAPGFAGKCLPKDLAAILASAALHEIDMPLMRTVQAINESRHSV
jgi:UDPglucose 6-dehydrogenase